MNCAWLQLDIIEAVYKTVYAPSNYYCIHLRAHCARILLCVSTCWCATVCLTLCFNAFAKRWSRNTETELLHKCLCLFVVFARSAILFFTFILFFSFCLCALFSRSTFRMCYCCWLCFLVSVALMRTNKFRLRFVIASTVRNAFFPLLATASFRTIIFVMLLHFGFSTIYFLIFSIIFVQLNTLGIILMRIVVPI